MKITALVENTCESGKYSVEHGLSLYIETDKHKILFDMGQTELFCENAKKLGVDLGKVDFAVLSHGHYDHGGGLERFMQINTFAPVYINKNAFGEHYNGTEKYIGLDSGLKNNKRFVFCDEHYEIDKGINLYSCNKCAKNYDMGSSGLLLKQGDEFVPDSFYHEQYLMIEENDKKVLISGCSHKGILNIAEWFKADVIIGGFHFSKLPLDDELADYAKILDSHNTLFYTCHCTGTEQYDFMKKHMKRLSYISTGETIEI